VLVRDAALIWGSKFGFRVVEREFALAPALELSLPILYAPNSSGLGEPL